ncbi:MAG: GAF domain-containing protein [Chloroflexi bacterium]|nr:GAF domain-containing protein [Chloroflexota bacterium]
MMLRNTDTTPSVPGQIVRRVAPAIVLAFAVFALVGSYLYQDNIHSHVNMIHVTGLADYTNQINLQLEQAVTAAQRLARGAATRVFTQEKDRLAGQPPTALLNGQAEMVADMSSVLANSSRAYYAVRYVDSSGTIWSEVLARGTAFATDTRYQSNVLANDPIVKQASASPTLTLSPVSMRQISPGVVEPAIRVLAPVTANDNSKTVLGLIELEVLARPILNVVNLADEGDGQRWVLVNRNGRYLADNTAPRAYFNSLSPGAAGSITNSEPALANLLANATGDLQLAAFEDAQVSSRQVNIPGATDMPWTLVVLDRSGFALHNAYLGMAVIVLLSAVGCAGTLALLYRVLRRRLATLDTISTMVTELAAGRSTDVPPADSADDLILALQKVSAHLHQMTVENEDRTTRQQRNIEIATRITQETAALSNVDDLVNRVIDLICNEYGFYHAQVYLTDDVGLNVVLRYSRGLIGQRLLEQNIVVPTNQPNIISTVARTGRAIRINDLANQINTYERLLGDSRAQLALPLLVGTRVIGVLDIHSIVTNAFREDEQRVFQLLANQIAAAIQNARLLVVSQQRLQQIDSLNRQLTRRAWDEVQEQSRLQNAYRYNLMTVEPVEGDTADGAAAAISAPISIRGEVIGTIDAAAPPDQPFTQGDQMVLRAVAERVGMVIEGARLFKETQSALAVTSLLYQISRYLNEANTLEDIIQAIVAAAMSDATGGQVWLFDDYPVGGSPEWVEIVADWSGQERAHSRLHLRLYLPESPFLTTLNDNRVKLVQDVALDQRLDSHLRQLFLAWGTRAAVFIPFSVRGVWRGLITMEFPRPRDFTEREGRIYSALIDQSGVAIDNRLLYQQTETTLDQIERLYAASRIINHAQTFTELVHAAAAATKDPGGLQFEIGLLEGQLDSGGWPTRVRKVARWQHGQAHEEDSYEPLNLPLDSPMRHREPQVIADPNGETPFTALFPMFSANQPIAVLYLYSATMETLSDEDYEVYQALTGQMSTMLENRRLLDQTAQALDETRRLYDASRAITGAADLNAVYDAAAAHLAQAAEQMSRIAVLLAGPDPGLNAAYFDTVHVWERRPTADSPVRVGLRLNSDAAPLGDLMSDQGGEPVYLPNIDANLADNPRLRQALQRGGAASVIVAPLRTQRHWFGVLVCEGDTLHSFDEQYIRFVRAVADQVAIAVENRQLFDEARQEAQRALALAEAGQLASRVGGEFDVSLSEVFKRVADAAGYDRWLVMLVNEDNPAQLDNILWHTPGAVDDTPVISLNLATAQHSIADAVRLNRTLIVNNPATYPAFANADDRQIEYVGKHIAMPIYVGDQVAGALAVGRSFNGADLDERDEQLLRTLAAQVGIATENRRLFRGIENERQYLRSVLESMPTGILVLDARTFRPIQANAQIERLLNRPIDYNQPFSAADYNLYRTGTSVYYPTDELPIFAAAASGQQDFSDDLVVMHDDGTHTDLLLNAAPILDARGNVTTIVAAFQDISNLRGLENALQDNLRETIALYEVTRSLSEAVELDAVLDIVIMQLMMLEASDGYIVLLDEQTGQLNIARAVTTPEAFNLPQSAFQADRLLIPDSSRYYPDTDLGAALHAQGVAALASFPLRARDNLLGWIVITYDQPRFFSPEDERFLTTLSDGAAVTIDNRNLFARTELAYQEAATLYQTSRALANAASSEDVLHAIVQNMNRPYITQAFMAVPPPYEQNDIPEKMQVVAYWQRDDVMGMNLQGITLSQEQFPAWRLITSPSMLIADDVLADVSLTEMEQVGLESMDIRALVALPLRAGSQLIGAIWLVSNEPYRHTEADYRVFQSLVEQASLSVQARRLLAQTERRARQLSTSAEVSQIASSILDLNILMPQIVNLIREAFRYDHVQIFLMDATDTYAELRASTGEAGQQLLAIGHKLAKGSASVIGQVTATGKPVLALDTADARFVHKPNPFLPLTRSEMALPLTVKGRVVGALDVQSNEPNAFTQEDVNVLLALAGQISIAIDNASLFEQSERRARDMGFLFTVTAAAALPEQSLTESLQNVAELVLSELNAQAVGIYMTEQYVTETDEPVAIVRPVALAGSDQPLSEISEVRVDDPHNLLGLVAGSREPVIVDDVQRESRYLPITASARSAGIVPMVSGGEVIGLIAIEDARTHAFNPETLTLLRTLNTTLSAIVQNATLLDQVRKQNDQLRELDKLKSDFLANMSHELRTPLNSIIGFSRVILKGIDGPLTEMQEQDLSTIYNSGQHLLGLINDILDQAKINSGKMDLQQDYFDMKPVVEGVRSIGIGLVKDKPIDIRLDIASGLPKVYGDEFRTRQVLLNLVSNAAKFTQQGSITIQVYLEKDATTGRDMVRVDVSDTGIGIAEKDLPLLFEAFRQVDSSLTRTVGGTGLGLVISKSLIEMQGGRMIVRSEVNVGSTFSVLMPLQPTEPTGSSPVVQPNRKKQTGPLPANGQNGTRRKTGPLPEPAVETAETAIMPRERRGGTGPLPGFIPAKRQILLIEDNPDMVDQYRRALQREGFDIFAASIPLEAEAMASGLRPTLIIMDVDFGGGAGWDILSRLRQRDDTRDIPVIVCTLNDDRQRADSLGAFAFVQRPFMPDHLVKVVREAEADSQTERILIIDDQPDSARLIQQVLDENGRYRVFTAGNGIEGVSMVARYRPDLVILDLRMPEMDGFAVLDELQANPETAGIPILIVTADTLQPDEQGRLANTTVLYKTDLSRENYAQLIRNLKTHLARQNGE